MVERHDSTAGKMTFTRPPKSTAEYERLAEPVLAYAERLALVQNEDMNELLRHASTLLDRFAADATRAGMIASSVPPARYALALIIDLRARTNRSLDLRTWAAGAHRYLFDGRDVSTAMLHDFTRRAAGAGPDFEAVHGFLQNCVARIEGQRRRFDRSRGTNWTGIVAVLVTAFALAVLGWASFKEWQFHSGLSRAFQAAALQIGLDRTGEIADLSSRLDQLEQAVVQVRVQRAKAPLTIFAGPIGFDAAIRAEAQYDAMIERQVPRVLANAVDAAIASQGDPIVLYDTLRAWSILSGQADWAPDYLAGWADARASDIAVLRGLSDHIVRLRRPVEQLPQPDFELLAQATTFAAESPEPERAYLELNRSAAVAALPEWVADAAVPGLSTILQRQSGTSMSKPVAGLFGAKGWDYARDFGAGIAVQTARTESARLFPQSAIAQNNSPDLVMDLLQRETLAQWSALLDDLRVRAFSDKDTAVLVSGELALPASPLENFLREIWAQAGGNDRKRSHSQQLKIAAEFAAMIQYVEQGRTKEIAALFASLNVALGAVDRDQQRGQTRLMTAQDRARSVAALRAAPRVVVQIVEDTLAQTGAEQIELAGNPLTRAWQAEALPACLAATEGRFPFADGADADVSSVGTAFAPNGVIERFFKLRVEALIDTSESPWRWKPEARFAGLTPDSALFFQKARAITAGLYGSTGQLGADLSLTALAERGKSIISIGGQGGPVEATSESLQLNWPGASPDQGVDVSFQTADGGARLQQPGQWGLFHILAPLRLREREGGKRFLVDLRVGGARLFLEIGFASPNNPLSARSLLGGFRCPSVL